jgi:hypothetical protein
VCDGVVDSSGQVWSGVGAGWGRLEHRSVEVTATGRRLPGQRCRTFEFPATPEVASPEIPSPEIPSPEIPSPEIVVSAVPDVLELQNAG